MSGERIESLFNVLAGASVAATNGGGGPTAVTVPAGGSYFITDLVAEFQNQLNASRPALWTVTLGADGRVTIACATVFSITWTSPDLRDALGFDTGILAAGAPVTGVKQAKFIWYPGCSLASDSDPKQAPVADDGRASINPQGGLYGIVSSSRPRRHRNVRFEMVDKSRVWAADALFGNADWETFYLDSQRRGHPWGKAYAPIRVYWDNGGVPTQLGNGVVSTWNMPKPVRLDELHLSVDGYAGLVDIVLGDLFSSG